jgi:hypothetical protein
VSELTKDKYKSHFYYPTPNVPVRITKTLKRSQLLPPDSLRFAGHGFNIGCQENRKYFCREVASNDKSGDRNVELGLSGRRLRRKGDLSRVRVQQRVVEADAAGRPAQPGFLVSAGEHVVALAQAMLAKGEPLHEGLPVGEGELGEHVAGHKPVLRVAEEAHGFGQAFCLVELKAARNGFGLELIFETDSA